MKIAIVHDFFLYWGGGERVVQGFYRLFPDAVFHTLLYNPRIIETFFPNARIQTSPLHRLPLPYRLFFPLMPSLVESFDLDDYDIVISSGTFSKGVITRPGTAHIHYCHTPPRFLWEEQESYVRNRVPFGLRNITNVFLHWLRLWDRHAGERPDVIIANSQWTKRKIQKIYGREAKVVYPFVEIPNEPLSTESRKYSKGKWFVSRRLDSRKRIAAAQNKSQSSKHKIQDYFLIVSRLQQYKNLELPIRVFTKLGLPLYIVGEGPDRARLARLAGPAIRFLGFKREEHLPFLYRYAKAVILPGVEDFGLTPVEAMAQGTPVLAYRKGGAMETIVEGKTGEFFDHLSAQSFLEGLKRLQANETSYDKRYIVRHINQFSFEAFKKNIEKLVAAVQKEK